MVDGKFSRAERKSLPSLHSTTHQHDYQLLAHLIVLLAASVSSSSLAKVSTATIANTGEQAKITLAAVQANSKANSIAAASLAFVVTADRSNAVSPSWRADILLFDEQIIMTDIVCSTFAMLIMPTDCAERVHQSCKRCHGAPVQVENRTSHIQLRLISIDHP